MHYMEFLSASVYPHSKGETWKRTLQFSFQSLGIVYGRLSIAPLYLFGTLHPDQIESKGHLYGLVSFIFWTMTLVPLLKYAFIVLQANDKGEGGTFALYSLLCRHAKVGLSPNHEEEVLSYEEPTNSSTSISSITSMTNIITEVESRARRAIEKHKNSHYLILFLALFGSCMVIADGVLTPALSVLSASSGVEQSLTDISILLFPSHSIHSVSKVLKRYVLIPSACAILICLFTLQRYGTHKIGFIFAPIVILWLLFITGVGIHNIFHWNSHIIHAISPEYMYKFVRNISYKSWKSLGSVLLCIAGSEAIFANLGHFSKKSLQISFVFLIYPAVILSYVGQAAYISHHRFPVFGNQVPTDSSRNITYLSESIPKPLHHIFTVLSLLVTAVGSQATITATFSIIKQCLALDCFPRVKVIHTSDKIHGQVYIPDINWVLMLLSLTVTLSFREIGLIGNATGLAIIFGMLVTTCLMTLVIAFYWEKSVFMSSSFLLFFGFIESIYLSACLLSFHRGAWFLVLLLTISMTSMVAWHYGTMKKYEIDTQNKVSMDWLTGMSSALGVVRVPGIGFIYTDIVSGIPAFFSHFVTNLPAFQQVIIFVSLKPVPEPCVSPSRRFLIGRVGRKEYRMYRCILRYGYCDRIRDTGDFEEQVISSIGEFISTEGCDTESLTSPEGKMIVIDGRNTLTPLEDSKSSVETHSGSTKMQLGDHHAGTSMRKKVRFELSPDTKTSLRESVKEELQQLVDARERGSTYLLGQSHLCVRSGSNFLKQFLIMTYVFLDKNCREPPVGLNIPHAALVEVGMVYNI